MLASVQGMLYVHTTCVWHLCLVCGVHGARQVSVAVMPGADGVLALWALVMQEVLAVLHSQPVFILRAACASVPAAVSAAEQQGWDKHGLGGLVREQ
jgi:hypothetical protein